MDNQEESSGFNGIVGNIFGKAASKGQKMLSVRIDEQIISLIIKCVDSDIYYMEYSTIVKMVYYYFSLCCGSNTPGMSAVGLILNEVNEGTKYFPLLLLVIQWAAAKIQSMSYQEDWSQSNQTLYKANIVKIAKVVTGLLKLTSFSNVVYFLGGGEYPSLIHRVAGSRMEMSVAGTQGYKKSHLFIESRKMLWYTLIGLTSALTMSVDWKELKLYCFFIVHKISAYILHGGSMNDQLLRALKLFVNIMNRALRPFRYVAGAIIPALRSNSDSDSPSLLPSDSIDEATGATSSDASSSFSLSTQPLLFRANQSINKSCAICNLDPAEMPHTSDCGHLFCYLCLFAETYDEAGDGHEDTGDRRRCPVCFTPLSGCRPYDPEREEGEG